MPLLVAAIALAVVGAWGTIAALADVRYVIGYGLFEIVRFFVFLLIGILVSGTLLLAAVALFRRESLAPGLVHLATASLVSEMLFNLEQHSAPVIVAALVSAGVSILLVAAPQLASCLSGQTGRRGDVPREITVARLGGFVLAGLMGLLALQCALAMLSWYAWSDPVLWIGLVFFAAFAATMAVFTFHLTAMRNVAAIAMTVVPVLAAMSVIWWRHAGPVRASAEIAVFGIAVLIIVMLWGPAESRRFVLSQASASPNSTSTPSTSTYATPMTTGTPAVTTGPTAPYATVGSVHSGKPPALTMTIVITALFGMFGIIPAVIHSTQAKTMGDSGGRYWIAFAVTLAAEIVAWVMLIVILTAMSVAALDY